MGPGNRPLDLEWLEDFVALAERGNFSRAAVARAIAQPAFSRHIRALEQWVGTDLFDRSGHPAALTAAGRRFYPLLLELLAGLEAARIKARAARDLTVGRLSFALTHSLALDFFPHWLQSIEAALRVDLVRTVTDSCQACEDTMAQRRVQFMLCHAHPEVPGRLDEGQYPQVRLGEDLLVPVSAPGRAGRPRHRIGAAEPPPVLAYTRESGLGRILKARLPAVLRQQFGVAPRNAARIVFQAHDAGLLKAMVLAGRGLAWLPRRLVEAELGAGTLCLAGDACWHIPVDIRLYRQPAAMVPTAESLWVLVSGAPVRRGRRKAPSS